MRAPHWHFKQSPPSLPRERTTYDLYATMLHLLGIDHEPLTYRYGGRDFRLTDVHGRVLKDTLA